jgi:SAM-dependent methyltransferase
MIKTFDQAKEKVVELCRHFETNRRAYHAPGIKEAHVRQSLIDPMFEALGWDVRNEARAAPQYREVIPEDSLDVEGHQKAPDYTFRVGTLPKFYAEAKKCGVNIHADPAPAYQLRRYGWSAKVPLSILTDFEELAVYECSRRPHSRDKASSHRILFLRFDDYPDRWRELWDIFSRDAVWSGAFDQYAASKRKRGTSEVDEEFLKEIEGWRDGLARNVALRNLKLSSDDLNSAVQRTIDRVVFLRMAEDRGLEPYQQLLGLCERPGIYARFMRGLCRKADEKYNSGLFHFQKEADVSEPPDRITPGLAVDDKVFKPILQSLYFEHGSPYHFGVLPVEILGTVYERFLGRVIRLTAGHQARIEEKPEVRKAGGVYYTPAYIVEYIVKHTVGRQIEGRSPAQLAGRKGKPPLRVLDMACGSGSFLLGAYQCLLDHYLLWYTEHGPESHRRAVHRGPRNGGWRLTIAEKKRILTTHIFGVDIDPQAVEVSKLSLLLKALEGEDDASLSRQLELFHTRALPNLADNIKCGNSLIGPDYFTGDLLPDPDEMRRVNPFDWKQEFPEAMRAGGFDCVFGNPPYVLLQNTQDQERHEAYLMERYRACAYKIDTYHLFLENAVRLTRPGGQFGFIVPNTFLRNRHAYELRSLLLEGSEIEAIRLFDYAVFPGASVDTAIVVARRETRPRAANPIRLLRSPRSGEVVEIGCVPQRTWVEHPRREFQVGGEKAAESLKAKIEGASFRLGQVATAYFGIQTHDRTAFVSERACTKDYRPAVDGANIGRYRLEDPSEYVCFRPEAIKSGGKVSVYSQARIGVRQIGQVPIATWIPAGIFTLNTIYNIFFTREAPVDLRFVLAVINSRACCWYWQQCFFDQKRTFPKVKKPDLLALPIPVVGAADMHRRRQHDRVVDLVGRVLALHRELAAAKSEGQRQAIQRQIDATDAEIDRLVYELYGLTPEEIAIVEGTGASSRA